MYFQEHFPFYEEKLRHSTLKRLRDRAQSRQRVSVFQHHVSLKMQGSDRLLVRTTGTLCLVAWRVGEKPSSKVKGQLTQPFNLSGAPKNFSGSSSALWSPGQIVSSFWDCLSDDFFLWAGEIITKIKEGNQWHLASSRTKMIITKQKN
jgi:hypothetical protein